MKKNKNGKFKYSLILFIVIFIVLFIIHKYFNIGPKQYYFDVASYNEIGKSFFKNGHYNLLSFSDDFRGFVFPTFMGFCDFLNTKLGIHNSMHIVSSLILSLLLTVYLNFCKSFFYQKNEEDNRLTQRFRPLIPVLLLVIFFYGLIVYPLTDLYAALFCIDSAFLIWSADDSKKYKKLLKYFFAGFLLYITYNIRTIYQLSLFLFLGFIVYNELKNKKIGKTIISTIAYASGVIVAAIPQIIMNFSKYENISIWINNKNLFGQQLFWGLGYDRYATFIGNLGTIRPGGMYFVNSAGMNVALAWQGSGDAISILSYIKYFFHYPIEYISMFIKHAINSFFVLFPEQYVQNIDKGLLLMSVLSLILVFTFLILLFIKIKSERINLKRLLFIFAMVFPSMAILFGAVEERFLVLPYLLIYGFIAFFDFKKLKTFFSKKSTVAVVAIIFVAFMTVSYLIESGILSELIIGETEYPLHFINK